MDNNEKNFENDIQNLHINDESQPENVLNCFRKIILWLKII
jgi:hypothetical protein